MRWLLALCLVVSGVCDARPYTADDLVARESYGQVVFATRHKLLLVERRRAWGTAADYGYGSFTPRLLSSILVADTARPERLTPLFEQDAAAGYWMGGLSPNGARLAVFRLKDRKLSLGVVELSTRTARWFPVTPDLAIAAPTPNWLDDDQLLVSTIPDNSLPELLAVGNALPTDQTELWKRAFRGEASSTVVSTRKAAIPEHGTRSLVSLDVRTGIATPLMNGVITDVLPSPDGKRIAVVTAGDPRPPTTTPLDPAFVSRLHTLHIVDIRTARTRLASTNVLPAFLRWSFDTGKLIAFEPSANLHGGRFLTVDPSGSTTYLASGIQASVAVEQSAVVVQAAWIGNAVVARMVDGASRWMRIDRRPKRLALPTDARLVGSDRTQLTFQSGDALIAMRDDLRPKDIARSVVQSGAVSLDPASIGTRPVLNPDKSVGGWVAGKGGKLQVRDASGTVVAAISPSDDLLSIAEGMAVTLSTDSQGVGRLRLHADNRTTTLDTINTGLADVTLPLPVRLQKGDDVHWLFLPPGISKPPLIVVPYPGQHFADEPPSSANPVRGAIPTSINVLIGAGFAVLLPAVPAMDKGTATRSLVQAVETATDSAIQSGKVDPVRIGILGHSFGGYASMVLATGSTRFRAAVAASGPYDLAAAHASMAGADRIRIFRGLPLSSSAGWAEGGQAAMRTTPQVTPNAYRAVSPFYAANRGSMPILLLHGDGDVVAIDQAERMFMALARQGRDATLVRYWGEGHVFASPANIRDYWSRTIDFFNQHLNATPEPMLRN